MLCEHVPAPMVAFDLEKSRSRGGDKLREREMSYVYLSLVYFYTYIHIELLTYEVTTYFCSVIWDAGNDSNFEILFIFGLFSRSTKHLSLQNDILLVISESHFTFSPTYLYFFAVNFKLQPHKKQRK